MKKITVKISDELKVKEVKDVIKGVKELEDKKAKLLEDITKVAWDMDVFRSSYISKTTGELYIDYMRDNEKYNILSLEYNRLCVELDEVLYDIRKAYINNLPNWWTIMNS